MFLLVVENTGKTELYQSVATMNLILITVFYFVTIDGSDLVIGISCLQEALIIRLVDTPQLTIHIIQRHLL